MRLAAQVMIGQGFDDPALAHRSAIALVHHARQFFFEALQGANAGLDGGEILAGNGIGGGAIAPGIIGQVQ